MVSRSDLIEKWAATWSSGDVDTVADCYTEDVVYKDVTFEVTFNGKDEFRGFIKQMYDFAPDLKLEIESHVVDGDNVAFEWTMSGTQQGDLYDMVAEGKPWSVKGMSRAEFSGDKMSFCMDYWDMVTVRKALGHSA